MIFILQNNLFGSLIKCIKKYIKNILNRKKCKLLYPLDLNYHIFQVTIYRMITPSATRLLISPYLLQYNLCVLNETRCVLKANSTFHLTYTWEFRHFLKDLCKIENFLLHLANKFGFWWIFFLHFQSYWSLVPLITGIADQDLLVFWCTKNNKKLK